MLEEMAEMVKTEILVTLGTQDPLVHLEIKAPRVYKDPPEMLDLQAPQYVKTNIL